MIIIGDVHGKFAELTEQLTRLQIERTTLIQVGDFGVGFFPPSEEQAQLEALNDVLRTGNNQLYVIRGNHDNPAYFTGDSVVDLSNLHLLPDYSILEIKGKRLLLAGGAVSIDRKARKQGVNWWPGEGFRLDVQALDADLSDLWAVITHSAPFVAPPQRLSPMVFYFSDADPSLLEEITAERAALTQLYDLVISQSRPKYWFYGHYHYYANNQIEGTEFVLLDELQFYPARDYE